MKSVSNLSKYFAAQKMSNSFDNLPAHLSNIANRWHENFSEFTNSESALRETALIWVTAQRTKLLQRKTKDLTSEEWRVIRLGEGALQQLLSAHRKLILWFVATYQRKGYNSTNSDLEQEATLAFFEAVITFNPNKGAKLGTWAYFQIRARLQKITQQTIHDVVAKAKVMQSAPVFSEPKPVSELVYGERTHPILDKLTEKQRQVVFLYLEGLHWTEIAPKLQSTADAVRMLWNRAVQRLRLLLLGEGQQEEQRTEFVEPQSVEQLKNISESKTVAQPNNFSESQTVVDSNSFSEPLLKQLYRHVSQTFTFLRLFYKVKQGEQKNLQTQDYFFSNRKNENYQFWSDSACSKGARGSPSIFSTPNC